MSPIGTFDAEFRGGRALLNRAPHHTTAAIVAEVEDTRSWKDDEVRGRKVGTTVEGKPEEEVDVSWELEPESTFQIANCDRSIAFEINFTSAGERANSLFKLDTLISTLTEFRAAVEDEQRLYVERLERHGASPTQQ